VEAQQGLIDEIRFIGNEVTRESVMRQEMVVHVGEQIDNKRIEQSRQGIMNLGLFKTVKADIVPEAGQNVLLVTVEERFYFLPLPLLDVRLTEEEYSYGIEMRFDNLMGLNQRLKMTYEHKKSVDGDVPLRKESKFDYRYPRVIGTANSLGINGKVIRENIKEQEEGVVTGSYRLDNRNLYFNTSRWLRQDWISEGWRVGGGMGVLQQVYTNQRGSAVEYDDSQALELTFGLNYDDVEEHPYHREGGDYGYRFSLALPGIGSDYSYNRHLFYYRNYHPLQGVDANLNTQLLLGLANGQRFDSPAYNLGSNELRGNEDDVAEGNAMLQLNTEYHHHLTGYRQLRGVLFMDVGNAWPGVLEIDMGKLYPSVGFGMRWRVQSFVDVTLRADYAYAIDAEASKLYLSTSSSF
jgi:outer membrane protein assembly factor BamA